MGENQVIKVIKEEVNIKEQLDEVFVSHIERLLGTSYGIEGLALNLSTIPCLVFLAERETEIESFPFVPPERYDLTKLIHELSEVSLDPGEDVKTAIQDMIDKAYIEIGDHEKYFARKPTLSMSQLLDHIFPQMPGINLIAYLGQMIDEIHRSRREMGQAKVQLDQLLLRQGVPLKITKGHFSKENSATTSPVSALSERATGTTQRAKTRTSEWLKTSDIYSHLETDSWGMTPSSSSAPSLTMDPGLPTIQPMQMDPVFTSDQSEQTTKETEVFSPLPELNQFPTQAQEEQNLSIETTGPDSPETINCDPSSCEPEQETSRSDDDIEKQIAAFEEGLGLICPMCRNGKLESQSTARRKSYYLCSNKNCNFISWGRPFYHACPQCKIPFLIETTDHGGHSILKCPRATCRFWSEFPQEGPEELPADEISLPTVKKKTSQSVKKPKKRVVRRRVVRKKK